MASGLAICTGLALSPSLRAQAVQSDQQTVLLEELTLTADAAGQATKGYQPLESATVTLRPTPILDLPQAVNVVSQTVIRDQAAFTLDETLANISGIAQANTLGGTQDSVIRRGFGGNRDGSILTDGLKSILPRSFNLTTERVEVLKGAASTLYGILDPGGVVNVITKKPEYTAEGEATVSGSSFGGGSASLDYTAPIEGTGFAWRMIAGYSDVDYWRNFGNSRSWTIAPSISWRNDTSSVTLSYLHQDYSQPFDRGTIYDEVNGRFVDVDPSIRFDEPFNITEGKTDRLAITAAHQLADGWDLSLNYAYSRNTYSDNQARVLDFDAATGNVRRRIDATQGSTMYAHALRADISGQVELGGLRHELLFGASYDNEDTLRTDMIRCDPVWDFNIHDPAYGNVGTCTTVSDSDSDQTEQLRTGSIYVQDNIHLNDRWIVIGGLRYQNYDLMAGKGRPFVVNTDNHGDVWLPNLGLVYKHSPQLSLYANFGKTFRPQSSVGSYIGALEPERGTSFEIGAKAELANGLTANAAIYTADRKNVAFSETVGDETVVRAAGLVRVRGFEADIAGQITDQLSLIASYSYTDAVIKDDPDYAGNRLVNVPRHTGSVFLAYDFGAIGASGNQLKIGGGIRGASARTATPANDYDLPGYGVVDLFATYTIQARNPVDLQLNLKNVFDRTYYSSSIGTNAYGNRIAEPFNAVLSASVRF
ncbi:TonB-dependent siderophore receptor [Paracoccus sp. M683]|uniref:TonB-dependent siderophore receptor n=1 Tax=Paracoccus sp. M683 TaxID=2594268 RepID=UPI00163D6BF8|nr:TonB-dependent siderophore receptor [Paracoccus sp. M683]